MKVFFLLVSLSLFLPALPNAQVIDSTFCDVLANPQSLDGIIVRVKGTVIAGFEEFVVKDAGCGQSINAIWLSYPEGSKMAG
jgi:hypothetical protein